MSTSHKRTAAEQRFWDAVYQDRLRECMKGRKRDLTGCSRLAREETDTALADRRHSIANDKSRS